MFTHQSVKNALSDTNDILIARATTQELLDEQYDIVISSMKDEMNNKLEYRDIFLTLNRKGVKPKPFWNDALKGAWTDACHKEKIYTRFKGRGQRKQVLRG